MSKRIALLAEGSYPTTMGGVSTWCDQLITGLPDFDFEVYALTATGRESLRWKIPQNCQRVELIPMWGPLPQRYRWPSPLNRLRVEAEELARELWLAILGEPQIQASTELIFAFDDLAQRADLRRVLAGVDMTGALLNAWMSQRSSEQTLSVADAHLVASIAERVLGLMNTRIREVGLIHAASNGAASLLAMANARRMGVPFVMSEHGVYLRERYIALRAEGYSLPTRQAALAFLRTICTLCYQQAAAVLPVTRFNERWEKHLGTDPEKIRVIANGVDAAEFGVLEEEPEQPTLCFVGRIDPLKDLVTLLKAFALVVERVPAARLRIFGPVPQGNEGYYADLLALSAQLELGDALTWEGPSSSSMAGMNAATVVVLSSISEGLPYTVLEAMMCARATVSTEVGGVLDCVGADGVAGRTVPACDPQALAGACVQLLENPQERRRMGAAARERAEKYFSLATFLQGYREQYEWWTSDERAEQTKETERTKETGEDAGSTGSLEGDEFDPPRQSVVKKRSGAAPIKRPGADDGEPRLTGPKLPGRKLTATRITESGSKLLGCR